MLFKAESELIGVGYLIVIVLLCISLAFILYLRKGRNKSGGNASGSKLTVIDKVYLDNKTKVFVIRYNDGEYIIASNSSSVSITDRIDKNKLKDSWSEV